MNEKILIKTNNFGWIWRKDYENPRFSFLKRDKGVPYIEIMENKWESGTIADKFGNKKKGQVLSQVKRIAIAEEYYEWEKLHRARIYAQSLDKEINENSPSSIDSLYNEQKLETWDKVPV